VSITVNQPASSCGSGGSCSSADVASHNTQSNCWMIIKYTSSGGNGTNGQVYKISSNFFGGGGDHANLPGGPSLSANGWCGKNISSTFNGKHSGGSRSDGSNSAIWWLTNNGNSLIGPYSGS
jgi:predicted heme/steroid binding protein